ncbi:MAG: HAD family hydrolase [Alkalispirochaeta sp.]
MKTVLLPDKPPALLFDIDNTLYHNDEYVRSQNDGQIERYAKVRGISFDDGKRTVERARTELERKEGRRPSLAQTLVSLGIPIRESITWRRELIAPERYLQKDDEVRMTLQRLARHFRLAALTNNPREIGLRSLEALGIHDLFESVTGLDDAGESKPSWGPFAHALEALGIETTALLMVGDRYDVDLDPVVCRGGSAILVESREDLLKIPRLLEERYALSDRP